MTPEQLKALMEWVDVRIEQIATDSEDRWKWDRAVDLAKGEMYDAFGFDSIDGEPVTPGTYPPTTGGGE